MALRRPFALAGDAQEITQAIADFNSSNFGRIS